MLDAPKIELRRTLHKRDRKIIAVPLTVGYRNTRTNPTRSERGTCKLLLDCSRPKGLDVASARHTPSTVALRKTLFGLKRVRSLIVLVFFLCV